MSYKLMLNSTGVFKTNDEGLILGVPADSSNTDWQEYQAWLVADPENNIPEPADEE